MNEIGYSLARGMDLLLKYRHQKFRTWVSYSYGLAELNFRRISKESFPADYDQRHIFQWSTQYAKDNWQVAIGAKVSSGLPYSKIDDIRMSMGQGGGSVKLEPIYSSNNNFRLPAMKEVNLSCQYQLQPHSDAWKGYVSFSITNLFNADNIYSRNYYVDQRPGDAPSVEIQNKSNLIFTPDLSLRIEW